MERNILNLVIKFKRIAIENTFVFFQLINSMRREKETMVFFMFENVKQNYPLG